MNNEEFERHKAALKAQKLEKPKRLSSQYSLYINEISLQQYHFDRSEKEAEIITSITKDQVLEYYKVEVYIHVWAKLTYISQSSVVYCTRGIVTTLALDTHPC